MKKIYSCFLLLLFASSGISAQTSTSHKKKTAEIKPSTFNCPKFREIKWGSVKDSIKVNGMAPTFVKAKLKEDTCAYSLQDDDMTIGTVVCKNIYYSFNASGRLNKVRLVIPKSQKSDIKYILETKFEKATQIFDLTNAYELIWNNIEEVRLTLTDYDDPSIDFVTVEFTSDFEMTEAKKINRAVDDF
ncbi:MAG: hypothetical protein SGJ10_00920 [Bacteroidota bacterium]|nr:hypothetical protein [Bacteroidota bacterium]